jgi:hypothetical protein
MTDFGCIDSGGSSAVLLAVVLAGALEAGFTVTKAVTVNVIMKEGWRRWRCGGILPGGTVSYPA